MKSNCLLVSLIVFGIGFSLNNGFAQEKEKQHVQKIKIVENNKVILDTTIHKNSSDLDKELEELKKEKEIIFFKSGASDSDFPVWKDKDFMIIRRGEIDSILNKVQDRMIELRIKMKDIDEFKQLREEIQEVISKSKHEFDSMRIRIRNNKAYDGHSSSNVYFFEKGGDDKEVIIIRSHDGHEKEVTSEKLPRSKSVVVEKEISKGPVEKETKMVFVQQGSKKEIEIDNVKMIVVNKNVEKAEKVGDGQYEIITDDGKIITIKVSDRKETEAPKTQKKGSKSSKNK